MLNVDYVVSGSLRRQGKRLTVDRRACRDAHRPHRLGGGVRPEGGRRLARPRRDRQPHRGLHRQRDRDHRAQPRHPEAAELARRLGGAITAACGTCTASTRPTTIGPSSSSRRRCASTRPLRAHYAGLSFTHFQSAFQGWAPREAEIARAFEAAGQSLMVDDRDPAAHWAMGRALWLRGGLDQSIVELERAIDLSPNFAHGHYALAFVHSQVGRSPGRGQVLRPLAPPEPVRSDAVCHAGRPGHGPGAPGAVRGGGRLGCQGCRPPERACPCAGHCRLLPGAGGPGRGGADPFRGDPQERFRATASTIS